MGKADEKLGSRRFVSWVALVDGLPIGGRLKDCSLPFVVDDGLSEAVSFW